MHKADLWGSSLLESQIRTGEIAGVISCVCWLSWSRVFKLEFFFLEKGILYLHYSSLCQCHTLTFRGWTYIKLDREAGCPPFCIWKVSTEESASQELLWKLPWKFPSAILKHRWPKVIYCSVIAGISSLHEQKQMDSKSSIQGWRARLQGHGDSLWQQPAAVSSSLSSRRVASVWACRESVTCWTLPGCIYKFIWSYYIVE